MGTRNNLEETFFNLKTLTLSRRGTETTPSDSTLNRETSHSTSQQRIFSAVTSNSLLDSCIRLLRTQWKVLLVLLLVFTNILVVAVLHADLNHKLEQRIQELQHNLPHLDPLLTEKPHASSLTDGVPESRVKHIFLSLASQQSELSSLREVLKSNSEKLGNLERKVKASLGSQDMIFDSVIREANISLCSNEDGKLMAPVDAVFRLEFSAKVHGNTYINRKMFEIMKNSVVLRNGGSIRIRYSGKENRTLECSTTARETKSCYYMNEILLVYMKAGDNLQIVNKFVEEGGEVYDLRFCMRITDHDKVPGGAESLVITH